MPAPSDDAVAAQVKDIAAALSHLEGPLLPILHAVQAAYGHVPAAAIPVLAAAMNQTRAEIHGVVSFYHDFRDAPAGRHTLRLCRAEACQSVGADALAAQVKARLGVDWHETSAGGVTLEPVFCLGLCACGPAAQVDGRLVGRADAARVCAMIDGGSA
jgi:formate dehydrogenase subunit gamma